MTFRPAMFRNSQFDELLRLPEFVGLLCRLLLHRRVFLVYEPLPDSRIRDQAIDDHVRSTDRSYGGTAILHWRGIVRRHLLKDSEML